MKEQKKEHGTRERLELEGGGSKNGDGGNLSCFYIKHMHCRCRGLHAAKHLSPFVNWSLADETP